MYYYILKICSKILILEKFLRQLTIILFYPVIISNGGNVIPLLCYTRKGENRSSFCGTVLCMYRATADRGSDLSKPAWRLSLASLQRDR